MLIGRLSDWDRDRERERFESLISFSPSLSSWDDRGGGGLVDAGAREGRSGPVVGQIRSHGGRCRSERAHNMSDVDRHAGKCCII